MIKSIISVIPRDTLNRDQLFRGRRRLGNLFETFEQSEVIATEGLMITLCC